MSDALGLWIGGRLPAALAALLAMLLLWPGQPTAFADTAEGIEMRWETGFQSVYKDGEYARLRLTLTNRTGRDLRGDVVFAYYEMSTKEIAVPADLPRDTTIVVDMTVPGMNYNKDNNRIRFVEGGVGTGRQVGFLQDQPYVQAFGVLSQTVGVVARDPDTLNVLALLNTRGYDIRTIVLKEDDLPADSLQLEALDMLVLNDVPTGGWPQERVDAIRGWVIRGGKLIVSGGAGYAKTAEAFADLVPVSPGGTDVLESAPVLEAIGGEPLPGGTPITVSTGELRAGAVTLADGVPVAAVRSYGAGKVMYVAFDPSAEPFAGWGGSAKLWERLFGGIGLQPSIMRVNYGSGYNFWNYDTVLSYFPSLNPPRVGGLSLLFIVYVLIVAPVLYLVLRKLDRREWMWWMIPVLSVVCSVVIFAAGSSDKREVKAHSVRTVQLAGDGWADRSAAAAVFAPNGGTVKTAFGGSGFAVPLRDDDFVSDNVLERTGDKFVRIADGGAAAEWRDVPYWSIRKAWVHLGASPGYGRFETKIDFDGSDFQLEITNQTAADLKHVNVMVDGMAYAVGDLNRGESGTVRIPFGSGFGGTVVYYGSYGSQIFPYMGADDPYLRERGLLDAYLNDNGSNGLNGTTSLIVGFSSDREGWFEVNGDAVRSDNVTLWAQPVDLMEALDDGGAPGIVQPVVTMSTMKDFGNAIYDNMMLEMTDGTLMFEYPLPWREESFGSFTLRQSDPITGGSASLSAWNDATGEWEPVPINVVTYTLPGPADAYLTDARTVRMRLEVTGTIFYRLPDLELGGGMAE